MKSVKMNKNKVLLGLSGGVDSTTAALLLKEKGFEVIGYYFDVTGDNIDAASEAMKTAEQLGIELICEDVSEEFSKIVIDNFCSEYLKGRTPNPCIVCNPNIKFKKLIQHADEIGAYYIATGHYCRIEHDEKDDLYYVCRSANEKKDQSYMLYRLGQDVLSRLIFPLGDFTDKSDIRDVARKNNMLNAEKKDSQELCFVDAGMNYVDYIKEYGLESMPGKFIDKDGNILGNHKGIVNYTIGQRKGLGIALGKPSFITKIDCENNCITLGDNTDLFTKKVLCKDVFFPGNNPLKYNNKKVSAKTRYSAKMSTAVITVQNDIITALFDEPQRAVTPGQSIVFYHKDRVIGGGFIE